MKRLLFIIALLVWPSLAEAQMIIRRAAAPPGGWVPTDEANLAIWLDAAGPFYSDDTCSSSTTSGEVNCWHENGGTASDATGTTGPDYTTLGGAGAGDFDGAEYLAFTSDVSSTTITVVWAQRITSFPSNGAPWGGADDNGRMRLIDADTWRLISNDGSGASFDLSVTMTVDTDYVFAITYDVAATGNEIDFYVDGALVAANIGFASETIDIGRYGKPNSNNGVAGKQGTFLVYTAVLTGTALCDAMTYVGDQHGVSITCP